MSLVSSTLDPEQALVILMDGIEKGEDSDSAGEVSPLGLTYHFQEMNLSCQGCEGSLRSSYVL